jgi:DNA-binding beta-propeller fold protein YncE
VLIPKSPPAVTAGSHPSGIAVSRDGASVYVTNRDSNTVVTVLRRGWWGAGTQNARYDPRRHHPYNVAVSPGGDSVDVTNFRSHSVSQYCVGPMARW